jgi:hypothetical protein
MNFVVPPDEVRTAFGLTGVVYSPVTAPRTTS